MTTEILPAVLGIGNALVDVMINLSDESIIDQFGLPKGSMTLVNAELSEKIYGATKSFVAEVATGGSAANTIHAMANLGGNCGYLGKICDDDLGKLFQKEFDDILVKTHLLTSKTATGRVMAMVTPDSERTMATYLGAASEVCADDISPLVFDRYAYLYIEGYLVQDHSLIETAVKLAKQKGLKVAIDLSSFNIVEQNLDFLKRIVSEYVDIVFANEEEAYSFTGKQPKEALNEISEMCEIAVVKVGKQGSMIKHEGEIINIKPVLVNAVDTTGAGDNYAAGFLFGLTAGYDLKKCGTIASFISAKVVETLGARIPNEKWSVILKELELK